MIGGALDVAQTPAKVLFQSDQLDSVEVVSNQTQS